MSIETKNICPLGSECESIKDGVIHKCMWHIKVIGPGPQTDEPMDQWGCAIAFQPILTIEGNLRQLGIAASIQSLRNEVAKANEAQQILLNNPKAFLIPSD